MKDTEQFKVAVPKKVLEEISDGRIKELEAEVRRLKGKLGRLSRLENEAKSIRAAYKRLKDFIVELDELLLGDVDPDE